MGELICEGGLFNLEKKFSSPLRTRIQRRKVQV